MHVVFPDSRYHAENHKQLVFPLLPNSFKDTKSVPYRYHLDMVIGKHTEITFISLKTMQFLFLREGATGPSFLNCNLGPAGVQANTASPEACLQLREISYGMHLPLGDMRCYRPDWTAGKMVPLRRAMGGDYLTLAFRRVTADKVKTFTFSERKMVVAAKAGSIYPVVYICTLPLPGMQVLGRIMTVEHPADNIFNVHWDIRRTATLILDED